MGRTWEAMQRAERTLTGAAEEGDPVPSWTEDLASLEVAVHALEDRFELELGALRDELRENLAKAREQAAAPERAATDRLRAIVDTLRESADRIDRRTRWTLLAVLAIGLAVFLGR